MVEMQEWEKENEGIQYMLTIINAFFKEVIAENMRTWIDMIDKLINEYNNRKHSTIKMTPVEASKKENEEI